MNPPGGGEEPAGNTLVVTGLHPKARLFDIEYLFGRFGRILRVEIGFPHPVDMALVRYENSEGAKDAMDHLVDEKILGQLINIRYY